MMSKQLTGACPQPSEVRLLLNGRFATLEALDAIVEHYKQRLPDAFLTAKIASVFSNRNALRGIALKAGEVQFDNFASTPFPSEPTWAEDPFADSNWQWSLHNLTVIRYLLASHRKTREDCYMIRAEELLIDWMHKNFKPSPPSEFSWNDHATALRLENLLYFLEYGRRQSLHQAGIEALLKAIWSHSWVLADPAFYNRHTNHGFDQSYILYLAGAACPEFEDAARWLEVGKARTIDELTFAFTPEGVHVENSPGYHMIMVRRTIQIEEMFQHYEGKGLDADLRDLLNNALRFAAYMVKPDATLPIVGDSQGHRVMDDTILHVASGLAGYEEFRYSVTQGRKGTAPAESAHAFLKSGYAILRSTWEATEFSQSFYLLFKAGFLSLYHRHDDDLSFILYNKGEDWIVDAGLYRHEEQDPMRQHLRSARAHNVVVVDDLVQGRDAPDIAKSCIEEFVIAPEAVKVRGSHALYEGMKVSRELEYRRPDTLTIRDQVVAEDGNEHVYRVLFHIPADKEVVLTEGGAVIRSARSGVTLRVSLFQGKVRNIYTAAGQEKPEVQGWTSAKYGQIEKSTCLCFEGRGFRWDSTVKLAFEEPNQGLP